VQQKLLRTNLLKTHPKHPPRFYLIKRIIKVELKHIKELMTAMSRTGIKKIHLRENEFELTLERGGNETRGNEQAVDYSEEHPKHYPSFTRIDQPLVRGADMPASFLSNLTAEVPKEDKTQVFVTSPMVGTFYTAASPDDAPFIRVGDKVEKGTIVCIIEAMKVMNEVKANVTGTVSEVLVETAQPVEFGTKLFRITE
jgi:acetyl-CoA carboxylase biotin carboxyl carrier protein